MRLAVVLLAACSSTPNIHPDAAPTGDAATIGTSAEYWPCYFWDNDATKCSPKCANKTLLGRLVFGEMNTCTTAAGECPRELMTGPAAESGAGCCVYSEQPFKRVEFLGCE
jgi:hypothetical protein